MFTCIPYSKTFEDKTVYTYVDKVEYILSLEGDFVDFKGDIFHKSEDMNKTVLYSDGDRILGFSKDTSKKFLKVFESKLTKTGNQVIINVCYNNNKKD